MVEQRADETFGQYVVEQLVISSLLHMTLVTRERSYAARHLQISLSIVLSPFLRPDTESPDT